MSQGVSMLALCILILALSCTEVFAFVRGVTSGPMPTKRSTHRSILVSHIPTHMAPSSSAGNKGAEAKIFIGNIPFDVTEEEMAALLTEQTGSKVPPSAVDIVRNKKKRPRGFLFITFPDITAAQEAVDIIDGCMYGDRCLNSNLVDSNTVPAPVLGGTKRAINPSRGVYLSNLDYSLLEEEVWQMCDDIVGVGLVTAVRMPVDKQTKQPRGCA